MDSAWLDMEDDATVAELLNIARRHCKLALEHSQANTPPARRKAIQDEIQFLRDMRDALVSSIQRAGRA